MPQYRAGGSGILGGSSLRSSPRHVAGHGSHQEADSSTAALAREQLCRQVAPGDAWGGRRLVIHAAETHHYNRAPPGMCLFTLKHYYTKKERKKKERDDVLERQMCPCPLLPPCLAAAFLPLWSHYECHDPCGKVPSQPSQCEHPCFPFKWLSETFVFCLQRKLLPKRFFLNLFM